MILKYVVVLFNRYKSILYKHFFDNKCLSRIEHIDIEKQTIIVHTRGINTPLPIKFDALIKEEALLNSFSSRHASYIGYYYGVHSDRSAGNTGSLTNYFYCFADNPSNSYTIRGLDRFRDVVFVDKINKNQITRSPDQIMSSNNIIKNFPPLQACYIGILAGINYAKLQKKPISHQKLRLVGAGS